MKKEIAKIHFITDPNQKIGLLDQVKIALDAGIEWIQYRHKYATDLIAKKELQELRKLIPASAKLIINDRVDLVSFIDADGVHIGKEDAPPAIVRQLLGEDKLIGCTANQLSEVKMLLPLPIDYIGLGPLRFTHTKEKLSPILGFSGIQEIMNLQPKLPIIAIGGIMQTDISTLMEMGIHGVAVSSLLTQAEDMFQECSHLIQQTYTTTSI